MIKLICLDVDGTMVGRSGAPEQPLWDAAAAATKRGQHLAMCTARVAIGESYEWARRLDPDGWHAFHNGAALLHTGGLSPVLQEIAPEVWAPILDIAAHHGWVCETYSATDLVVDSDHEFAVEHARLLGIEHRRRRPADLDGPVVRLQIMAPLAEARAVHAQIPQSLTSSTATSPMMPDVALISITLFGVTKGAAIGALADLNGVGTDEVMMVGDGQNDLEAFAVAGVAVAMGNADPMCLDAADFCVSNVENGGAAEAIEMSMSIS